MFFVAMMTSNGFEKLELCKNTSGKGVKFNYIAGVWQSSYKFDDFQKEINQISQSYFISFYISTILPIVILNLWRLNARC